MIEYLWTPAILFGDPTDFRPADGTADLIAVRQTFHMDPLTPPDAAGTKGPLTSSAYKMAQNV
jgi:hypothetical protein